MSIHSLSVTEPTGNDASPTVTVIIPTYNRMNLVGQTIESILNQTRPPDEIVVIDDGSTDATTDVVSAFGNRVRHIRKKNTGKAATLNVAMEEVASDYIWLMDDDDTALPRALETQLAFLATHPEIDFCYGAHHEFSGDAPPRAEALASQEPMSIAAAAPENLFIRAMIWFPFYLQGMLVPRRCYREVGPFDESLTFTEDYDMILRLARRFRGGNVNAAVFCRRVHSGRRGPAHERRAASERSAAFRRYEHGIFARLHAELPLAEYLPNRPSENLGALEMRQARLQRACIMSLHGLFKEAFRDLGSVLDQAGGGPPLTPRERRILAQMLSVELWWLQANPHYPASVGQLLRRRGAYRALNACAVGLGWRLEVSLRRRRYGDAMHFGRHLRELVGVARLPGFFVAALMRRYRRYADSPPRRPAS
jgi:glycosyltransferase involved in cell wall biosynthesis